MFSTVAFLCVNKKPNPNPNPKKAFVHLRVSVMAELPGLGEGGQGSEVERQVLAHQCAVHLLGGTNDTGAPLEGGGTAGCLRQQLRRAPAGRIVADEQYG